MNVSKKKESMNLLEISFFRQPRPVLLEKKIEGNLIQIFLSRKGELSCAIYEGSKVIQGKIWGLPSKVEEKTVEKVKKILSELFIITLQQDVVSFFPRLLGGGASLPNFEVWMQDYNPDSTDLMDFIRQSLWVASNIPSLKTASILSELCLFGISELEHFMNDASLQRLKKNIEENEKSLVEANLKIENLSKLMKQEFPQILKKDQEIKNHFVETLKKNVEEKSFEKIKQCVGFLPLLFSYLDPKNAKRYGVMGISLVESLQTGMEMQALITQGASVAQLIPYAGALLLLFSQAVNAWFGETDANSFDHLSKTMIQLHIQTIREFQKENERLFSQIEKLLGQQYEKILQRIEKMERDQNLLFQGIYEQLSYLRDLQEKVFSYIDEKFLDKEKISFRKKKEETFLLLGMNISQDQTTERVAGFMNYAAHFSKEEMLTGYKQIDTASFYKLVKGGEFLEDIFYGINWLNQFLKTNFSHLSVMENLAHPRLWSESANIVLHIRLKTPQFNHCFSSPEHIVQFQQMVKAGVILKEFTKKLQTADDLFLFLIGNYKQALYQISQKQNIHENLQKLEEANVLLRSFTLLAFPKSREKDLFFGSLFEKKNEVHLFSRKDIEDHLIQVANPDFHEAFWALFLFDQIIQQKILLLKTGNYQDDLPIVTTVLEKVRLFWEAVYPENPPLPEISQTIKPIPFVDVSKVCQDNIFLLALYGCFQEVLKKVETGFDVNTKEEKTGKTLLHIAAKEGYVSLIQELLKRNAQILPDHTGKTPLDETKDPKILALLSEKCSFFDQLGTVKKLQETWASQNPIGKKIEIHQNKVVEFGFNPHFIRVYDLSSGKLLLEQLSPPNAPLSYYRGTVIGGRYLFIEHPQNHAFWKVDLFLSELKKEQLPGAFYSVSSISQEGRYLIAHQKVDSTKSSSSHPVLIDFQTGKMTPYKLEKGSFAHLYSLGPDDNEHKVITVNPAVSSPHLSLSQLSSETRLWSSPIPGQSKLQAVVGDRVILSTPNQILVYDLVKKIGQFSVEIKNAGNNQTSNIQLFENILVGPFSVHAKECKIGAWDIETKTLLYQFTAPFSLPEIKEVSFSYKNGKLLVLFLNYRGESKIEVFDTQKKKSLGLFGENRKIIFAKLEGNTLVTYDLYGEKDRSIRFWNLESKSNFYSMPLNALNIEVDKNVIACLETRLKAFHIVDKRE